MSRYAKAIIAFLTSLSTWGITALAVGANGEPATISGPEWFGLCGVLATTFGVFIVANSPPEGEVRDPNMSERAA